MKLIISSFRSLERNEKAYWIGLLLLFVGLTWSASVFVALTAAGAVMIVESVFTSYLAGWINAKLGDREERP